MTKNNDFQNTKFILAQLKTEVTVARTFIDKCIKEHINNNFSEDGAIAKLFCTELQFKVMDENVFNYLGDMDICKNILLQKVVFVDSRIQRIYGGTNEIMKEIISRNL